MRLCIPHGDVDLVAAPLLYSPLFMGAAVLNVANLRIERGDTVILDDVSWVVEPGQHWAIIGANGSGKTSLLSALTGYLEPTEGGIEVLGERFGESDWREFSSAIRQRMAEQLGTSLEAGRSLQDREHDVGAVAPA